MARRQKGEAYVPLAETFQRQFPLDPTSGYRVISLDQFDAWAANQNQLDLTAERDTINHRRNTLRWQINLAGCSPVWTSRGKAPFHVRVNRHGKSLVISPASDAWENKTRALPRIVESIVKTKRQHVKNLLGSVDLKSFPEDTRDAVRALEREGGALVRQMGFQAGEYLMAYERVKEDLQLLVTTEAIKPKNGAVADFLDDDDEAAGSDEDQPDDADDFEV